MNGQERQIIEQIAGLEKPVEAPRRDPAREENERALVEEIAAAWNGSIGADPMIDRAMKSVAARRTEAETVAVQIERTRKLVEAGAVKPEKAAEWIAQELDREEKKTADVLETARKSVEVGRERLLAELLPELAPNGSTTRERKADLALTVSGFEKPTDGFREAALDALARDDRASLSILLGSWGRSLYRSRGGDPREWESLRKQLIAQIADNITRRSPKSAEARKWALAVGGGTVGRYLDGEGARVSWILSDIPRPDPDAR